MGASEKDEEAIRKAVDFSTTARRQTGDWSGLFPARRVSGIGNWDQPKHTTCRGRPIRQNPTYSAFWALRASDCNGWPRRWVSGRRRDWDLRSEEHTSELQS